MEVGDYGRDGCVVVPYDGAVHAWARAAYNVARDVAQTPGDLRHGKTWRVGVDELPNASDGSIAQVPLRGAWEQIVAPPADWHNAQLSIVYPGYPQQDHDESDGAHRFRVKRDAAHVDGLLPEGPDKSRHLREPHAFILGLPLNDVCASPLVVWPGSHVIMRAAFAEAFEGVAPADWGDIDVTEVYQAARRRVFAQCTRVVCTVQPGEASLVHRHLLHGVAPWGDAIATSEGRMIAYFRPHLRDVGGWL